MPGGGDVAVTLWVLASYSIDAFRIFPKLLLSSPEKRCGKTTTLEVIDSLGNRSLIAASVSASSLFRAIDTWQPTLLIDEADTFIHGKDELRGVINSGHTKSAAYVLRSDEVQGEWQPRKFSTWTPMIMAMIKKPPSTIVDRSVVLELQRKAPGQHTQKLPIDIKEHHTSLRRKIKRWADDHFGKLKVARPTVPTLQNERAMDNWTPLLAVADLIGWGEVARSAMVKLSGVEDNERAIETELLSDIREVLDGKNKIFSKDLVAALVQYEDRPWCEWRAGKPMTQNSLSKLLKPYKVLSKTVRIGNLTFKGYETKDFEDVFNRYLPNSPSQSVTASQPASHNGSRDFQNVTNTQSVTFAKSPKPRPDKGCDVVTVQNATYGRVIEL